MRRLPRTARRVGQVLLLAASVVPIVIAAPLMVQAYSKFDRRHKSGPIAAQAVHFDPWEAARYHPFAAHPDAVPVLTYHAINDDRGGSAVDQATFTKQLALMRRMGYRSLTIEQYARFLRGDRTGLPQRPVLVTFDGGRLDSYRGADAALRAYGMHATMFVAPGRIRGDDESFLTWKELEAMVDSGRWDVQERAGDGAGLVNYDAAGHTGAFYAFRRWTRSDGFESLAAWEQRVTTDVFAGRDALVQHLPGFKALTFAVPDGNYGQRATNDAQIPQLLRTFLGRQFEAVFVTAPGDEAGYTTATPDHADAARFDVRASTSVDDVFRWLRDRAPGATAPIAATPTPINSPTTRIARFPVRGLQGDVTPCAGSLDTSAGAPAATCCSADSSASNIAAMTPLGSPLPARPASIGFGPSATSPRCVPPSPTG